MNFTNGLVIAALMCIGLLGGNTYAKYRDAKVTACIETGKLPAECNAPTQMSGHRIASKHSF